MSTASRPAVAFPPLVAGERLDRATFHRRYEAMPPGVRAELVDGVVHMPSPVGLKHGRANDPAIVWLSYYEENTPGVEALSNVSTALDDRNEVQPDVQLRILPESGGRTRSDSIVHGPPELVVEVAHSSKRFDLGAKLAEYEPDEVRWHALVDGRLVVVPPGADGLDRSAALPGRSSSRQFKGEAERYDQPAARPVVVAGFRLFAI